MRSTLRSLFLVVVSLTSVLMAQAQPGTIRGKVTNGTTGEVLLGATVRLLDGATVKGGAYTDLEGNYSIKAPAGTYTLIISYISFVDDTIREVVLAANAVVFNETLMFEQMSVREDLQVEITTTRNQATAVTLYNKKRNAINAIDGVSYDLIQRTGDANVAGAVTRIVGVTVAEGKYVYVRGLGDRYSKTTLNGAELPSLDPNQNAVQMDLFPSNLIDNIIVYKNFTPDLPGSFTGGLVDVRTKDFPDRLTVNFSAAMSYNPQANLRDDFLKLPEKGKTDWLGIDDGTRAIPDYVLSLSNGIPSPSSNTDSVLNYTIDAAAKSFKNSFAPVTGTSGIDQNYQLSIGNQYSLFKNAFGFIASLSYRNEFTAYQDGILGRYRNGGDAATGQILETLDPTVNLSVNSGQQEVLWGGLIKLSYKLKNHKYSFNYMHNQSGSSNARYFDGSFQRDGGGRFLEGRVAGFQERTLDVYQLQGNHIWGKLKADWIGSFAQSAQSDPDLRIFSAVYEKEVDGDLIVRNYQPNSSSVVAPTHFFRDLKESNFDGKLNFELPFTQWSEQEGKIKFGGAYTFKDRTFTEGQFFISSGTGVTPYKGDVDAYFGPQNLGIVGVETLGGVRRYRLGNVYQQLYAARNQYDADQSIIAAYAMAELPLNARLKVVAGARFETTDANIVSKDASVPAGVLNENDILPALNLIYSVRSNMNLRGGLTRTLARPTFREFSPFESFDFAGDYTLIGNPNLQRTLVDNADLRWEWFFTPSELVSVSLFYKRFQNPIERVNDPTVDNPRFIFQNIDQANTYGLELEFKKNFGFVSEKLSRLEIGGNLSLIRSLITINPAEYAQIVALDPDRPNQRPMFGQSPYAANAEISYIDSEKLGLQASLSYNIFGPRIAVVGGISPDVYEQPRGLLNFSLSKNIGSHFSLRFRANNLLNPAYKMTYEYKGQEYIFQNYTLGRSYSLGFNLNL